MTNTLLGAEQLPVGTDVAPVERSSHRQAMQRFFDHPLAKWWLLALTVLAVACYGAPIWHHLFPNYIQTPTEFDPTEAGQPPSLHHLFGTDSLNGHDIFSLTLYGGRLSLMIGVGSMVVAMLLATAIGCFAGYLGGWVDAFVMRVVDVLSSIPILLVLPFAAKVLGQANPLRITLILGIFTWPYPCRILRSSVLSLSKQPFIDASRAVGVSTPRIVYRHILPNLVGLISVAFTLGVGANILREAFISYLGFGLQPPQYSWGTILSGAQGYMLQGNWWWITFPGIAVVFTVLAINFIGDGLRDAFDPRVYG